KAGFVRFAVTYRNQVADFMIEDSGIGILTEDMDRIFEPFERGRLPSAVATAGTGLGLTITKLLTEIMGGEISLASEPGHGTQVRVRLLLSRAAEEPDAPVERPVKGYKGRRRTLIIADDDPSHRDLMQDMLGPLGFVLFTAEDGLSCLSLAGQCEPDLILLDIAMPGLSGWQVATQLASRGCPASIIMLSASVGEFGKANGAEPHHSAILSKPVDMQHLMDAIQASLKLEWDYGEAQTVTVSADLSPKTILPANFGQTHLPE